MQTHAHLLAPIGFERSIVSPCGLSTGSPCCTAKLTADDPNSMAGPRIHTTNDLKFFFLFFDIISLISSALFAQVSPLRAALAIRGFPGTWGGPAPPLAPSGQNRNHPMTQMTQLSSIRSTLSTAHAPHEVGRGLLNGAGHAAIREVEYHRAGIAGAGSSRPVVVGLPPEVR
jgi:hypothetical protein